jgi:DNA-binding GntR family transcriptional regulator
MMSLTMTSGNSATPRRSKLVPLRARSLRDEAAEAIRNAIISGELPEGAPVNETQLALQLGISRGPIREALRLLEQEGRVQTRQHRGAHVTTITLDDVLEGITFRELIEPFVIERSMTRAGQELVADLRRSLGSMREAAVRGDALGMVMHHDEFHAHFYRHAQHRLLLSTWERIRRPPLIHIRLQKIGYEKPEDLPKAHQPLLTLVESGDRDGARREILAHLRMNLPQFSDGLKARAEEGAAGSVGGRGTSEVRSAANSRSRVVERRRAHRNHRRPDDWVAD